MKYFEKKIISQKKVSLTANKHRKHEYKTPKQNNAMYTLLPGPIPCDLKIKEISKHCLHCRPLNATPVR